MPAPSSRRAYTLAELAERTGAQLEGDGAVRITRVGPLDDAPADAISFLQDPKYRSQLATTRAAAVILRAEDAPRTARPRLVCADPYATYAKAAQLLYPLAPVEPGIHPSAVVDPTARVAPDARVEALAVVGARTVVGPRALVGPGCVLGADVELDEDVRLVARVTVYDRCRLGARTLVHAGAVIGADGFGHADDAGRWVKIPQVGRVVVGADCEIGANTTIDRGAIDDTVLEDDVKLDNQIQIGHNCVVGRHTAMAGCTGVAGSVRFGRNCRIGGASIVMSSVDEPGFYSSVVPLLPYREWRHYASNLRRLRELAERVRALERGRPGRSETVDPEEAP